MLVKISFTDWWNGFDIRDNFITRTLDGRIKYAIVDEPEQADFVFCSVWKKDCFKYNCPRILYTGENYIPDFNIYDYAIGFSELEFGDRYIRYPLYLANYENTCRVLEEKKLLKGNELDRSFCSFVVSNGTEADNYRDMLFEKLMEYRFVSSGGRYRNNINCPNGVNNKADFLRQYKFNIACENVSSEGYCTEKIVEAFAANTIPIYWGDPRVVKYFNPKAFINCHECGSIEEVVSRVKQVDENPDEYMEMLAEPALIDGYYSFEAMRNRFAEWLAEILGQDKESAYRRARYGFSQLYEQKWIEIMAGEDKLTKGKKYKQRIKKILKRGE